MDPFPPNDPLSKLLGQTRKAEPRASFVRDVVRAARQTPQESGWMARLRAWWQGEEKAPGLLWAAAAALTLAAAVFFHQPAQESPLAQTPSAPQAPLLAEPDFPLMDGFEDQWQDMEQLGSLLVVNDTSVLTDREIHMLLY